VWSTEAGVVRFPRNLIKGVRAAFFKTAVVRIFAVSSVLILTDKTNQEEKTPTRLMSNKQLK
jgi:TctA family transporter